MRTSVAIVGGGLAGLCAARVLHAAGIDFRLLEARPRLGGRILTADESGNVSEDGFDLGPSWFWPRMQPAIAALVDELALPVFAQHSEGDVIFERMSREPPHRYHAMLQQPDSMRIVGGTGTLVSALARGLPAYSLWLGSRVSGLALGDGAVSLTVSEGGAGSARVEAEQVIVALPPRLVAATLPFTPAVEPAAMRRWRGTATWMAPHAKFFALYERPFWRSAGLSGTAQSLVGPLAEMHDATTASGRAALFGFLGIGAEQRAAIGDAALKQACLAQLVRLFGAHAQSPTATLLKDWATDRLTATAEDRSAEGHPQPYPRPAVTGVWQKRLSLGGSETSATEPGYLAGAVEAGARAARQVLQRLRDGVR